jgi:glycerol uptake facilitator-like aquaporin
MSHARARRLVAEGVGTFFLLAAIVGSGIMGDRLSDGNVALALLANALATAAVLTAIILTFSDVSGAHFNPAVTIAVASQRGLAWRDVPGYVAAQVAGGLAGVIAVHLMFDEPLVQIGTQVRAGPGQVFSEFVATFGLVVVIRGCARRGGDVVAFAVGAYILGAIWFTSSTGFANPAVAIARAITDTFTGIRPVDVPWFVAAQLAGAMTGTTGTTGTTATTGKTV